MWRGQCQGQNPLDHSRIAEAHFHGRLGKLVLAVEIWIGIGFQDHYLSLRGDPEIDPTVAANPQSPVNRAADFRYALTGTVEKRFGKDILDSPPFSIGVVPFGFESRKLWLAFGNFAKDHFAVRKDPKAIGAQNADVEFPSFDVFFRQSFLVQPFVNKTDALFEGGIVVDERVQRNTDGTLFLERFDEEREFEPLGSLDIRAGRENGEIRHANIVIGQKFLSHP